MDLRIFDGQRIQLFNTDNIKKTFLSTDTTGSFKVEQEQGVLIHTGGLKFNDTNVSISGNSSWITIGGDNDQVFMNNPNAIYHLPSFKFLSDIDTSSLPDGQYLKYNQAEDKFVFETPEDRFFNKSELSSSSGQSLIGVSTIEDIQQSTVQQQLEQLKSYVDYQVQGLDIKESVRVQTTENITLSGLQTIDGVQLNEGDRVLVKNQTNKTENGIYIQSSGQWTRQQDQDSDDEVTSGLFVFVEEGSINQDTGWVLITDNPIILGTTELVFSQFTGSGSTLAQNIGTGVQVYKEKVGNTLYFKTLNPTSNKISITQNTDTVDFDIVEQNINLNNLSGVLGLTKGGTNNSTYVINKFLIYDGTKIVSSSYEPNSFQAQSHNHTLQIGDGTTTKINLSLDEVLHIIQGNNTTIQYDDLNNKLTITAQGQVTSVNGYTGDVVLDYTDVGQQAQSHTHGDQDITDVSWSKITNTPTSLSGYGIPQSDVLGELTTVDGDGSGLDQDLLDGKHYSEIEKLVLDSSGLALTYIVDGTTDSETGLYQGVFIPETINTQTINYTVSAVDEELFSFIIKNNIVNKRLNHGIYTVHFVASASQSKQLALGVKMYERLSDGTLQLLATSNNTTYLDTKTIYNLEIYLANNIQLNSDSDIVLTFYVASKDSPQNVDVTFYISDIDLLYIVFPTTSDQFTNFLGTITIDGGEIGVDNLFNTIKLRRGTSTIVSQLDGSTYPVLNDGEIAYDKDTHTLKIGDGISAWDNLQGINADTLDGQHQNEFQAQFHTHTSSDITDQTDQNTPNTIVKRDQSGNFVQGTITQNLNGNQTSQDKLSTQRTISLTGDVSGSTTFDGSQDVSINQVVQNDSHTHSNSTITSVDWSKLLNKPNSTVQDIDDQISKRHSQNTDVGTSSATFYIGGTSGVKIKNNSGVLEVRNSQDSDYQDLVVNNLTVQGTTFTINSETVTIQDNILLLNSNYTGSSPTENQGMEVERGDLTNQSLIWDESNDLWKQGLAGSEKTIIREGNTIQLTGDVTGSQSFSQTGNLTLSQNVSDDSHSHSDSTIISIDWSKILNKPTTLSGYGISQTDVRDTLKTVDGSGSGIDQDLLDGIHQSSFVRTDYDSTVSSKLTISGSFILPTKDQTYTGSNGEIWIVS